MALLATPSNVCAINLSSRPARGSSSFSHLASGPPACREEGQLSTSTGLWAQLPSSGEATIKSIWAPLRQAGLLLWDREMLGQLQRESLDP